MNLTERSVQIAKREIGVSHHVPITHFNSPTILESKTGALFSVIKFCGVPFETEKTETINNASFSWHRALATLDERFALLGTIHRRKVNCELEGGFNNDFAKQVDQVYQRQFMDKSL
jgi:type IV secretory pathway VirB4 component